MATAPSSRRVRYGSGKGSSQLATGDFNGDGKLDLAVINGGTPAGFVSILLGNGDGTFQPKIKTPIAHDPGVIAAGDLNGDGRLDVVTLSGGNLPKKYTNALLGNGDGTFTVAWTVVNRYQQVALALADLNGDGKLDLAVTSGDTLGVRLGKGDGSFGKRVNYPVGRTAVALAIADFDGDGILDVAVANESSQDVSVLLGNGDGTFQPASSYPLAFGARAVQMVASDVNGDKRPDLVVTDYLNKVVSVLVNTGRR